MYLSYKNNKTFFLDKNTNIQSQETSFSFLQNIGEINVKESKTQCLETAEQLEKRPQKSYGFSDLDEYNSHIVPSKKSLEVNEYNTIPPKGMQFGTIFYIIFLRYHIL